MFGHLEVNGFHRIRTRKTEVQARTEETRVVRTHIRKFRKEDSREKPSWNLSHQQEKKIISKKSNMKQLS